MVRRLHASFLHVILPLLTGSLLYIGFRNENLKMFNWFDAISIRSYINAFRSMVNPYQSQLPDWIYYSLPDGLWVYSFASAYLILWKNHSRMTKLWLLIPFTLGCIAELAQGFGFISGTFDIIDLGLCLAAILLSILIFNQSLFKYDQNQRLQNH